VSFSPTQWPVQVLSVLPEALRVGALISLVVLLGWFVAKGGIPVAWSAFCRWGAVAVDAVLGLVLLVEYRSTSARRRRGEPPLHALVTLSQASARLIDRAARLHDAHAEARRSVGRMPWKVCLSLLVASVAAWVVMDRVPADSRVSYELSRAWERWRDVEAWADVPAGRRAERGPGLPVPLPALTGTRRTGPTIRVGVACEANDPCSGRLIVRSGGGRLLLIRRVHVAPDGYEVLLVGLAGNGGVPPGATFAMRR
jgi:hypothetical protein